jgi:hypothetical protein
MKPLIWIAVIVAVLIGGFFALNAYIRHEELAGGMPQDQYEGWAMEERNGTMFYYPAALDGEYYSAAEWPPVLTTEESYACDGEELTKDGITFCRAIESEGAAGSVYSTYQYQAGIHMIAFTLRFPQCANYDEPNASACRTEQGGLDIDALALRILSSVH